MCRSPSAGIPTRSAFSNLACPAAPTGSGPTGTTGNATPTTARARWRYTCAATAATAEPPDGPTGSAASKSGSPRSCTEIEVRAAEDENRRLERERQEAEHRRRWAAAIEQAKIDLVEASRVKHLDRQLNDWIRYRQLREFLAAMRRTIEQTVAEADRPAVEEWLAWAERHAAQLDPLARRLAMPEPPEPQPEALRPFLDGWSPYGRSGH